mmetsp:Transcript_30059/g.75512  ORF Transcript_30059/g.75512 Transcript_30059/m.75512 type:complete len:423 (+) Transcript_30059:717-1985(+)
MQLAAHGRQPERADEDGHRGRARAERVRIGSVVRRCLARTHLRRARGRLGREVEGQQRFELAADGQLQRAVRMHLPRPPRLLARAQVDEGQEGAQVMPAQRAPGRRVEGLVECTREAGAAEDVPTRQGGGQVQLLHAQRALHPVSARVDGLRGHDSRRLGRGEGLRQLFVHRRRLCLRQVRVRVERTSERAHIAQAGEQCTHRDTVVVRVGGEAGGAREGGRGLSQRAERLCERLPLRTLHGDERGQRGQRARGVCALCVERSAQPEERLGPHSRSDGGKARGEYCIARCALRVAEAEARGAAVAEQHRVHRVRERGGIYSACLVEPPRAKELVALLPQLCRAVASGEPHAREIVERGVDRLAEPDLEPHCVLQELGHAGPAVGGAVAERRWLVERCAAVRAGEVRAPPARRLRLEQLVVAD